MDKCTQDLGGTSKAVGSSAAQLLTCAAQGNEHYTGNVSSHRHTTHEKHRLGNRLFTGVAASETAQTLKTLAQAARGVAATTSDPAGAVAMLDSAREVMEWSAKLIYEAKQALVAPGDAELQQRLAQVSSDLRELLLEKLRIRLDF